MICQSYRKLALRVWDMGGARRESTPLMGGTKRQASFLTLSSFTLLVAAVLVLAYSSHGPVEMQQKLTKQQMLARALMRKGQSLENAGEQDVKMAKLLLSMNSANGAMLAGNDTSAGDEEEEEVTLEDRGVNVHSWPHEHEVQFLPNQKKKNSTVEFVEREVTHNHDWYHYDPLKRAGVNTGKWFWEDEDEMGPPEPVEAAPAGNETGGGNSTETEEEEEVTPEARLRKAGVKVGGWPWDSEVAEEPEEEEEEEEPEEPAEEEGEGEEPAAAKSRRTATLYQRGRAAYKQYQKEMAHRLLKSNKVH